MAPLGLDLDVDARAQIQLHQGVERLLGGLEDVEQSFVGTDLELLAALLVDVRRAQDGELVDARGQRNGTRHLRACALRGLHDLARRLVEQLVVVGLEPDSNLLGCHRCSPFVQAKISATTPAPTVRPPSRIAKRNSFSIAMGVISSTSIDTLSPGITISVPVGKVTEP